MTSVNNIESLPLFHMHEQMHEQLKFDLFMKSKDAPFVCLLCRSSSYIRSKIVKGEIECIHIKPRRKFIT